MKVLYIADKVEGYGSGNSLKGMLTCLSQYGVEPEIIVQSEGDLAAFAREKGFKYHIVKLPLFYIGGSGIKWKQTVKKILRPLLMLKLYISTIIAINKIEQVVDFKNIDLIHTNLNRDHVGALVAKKHNIPHVWHIREFGELDYNCTSLIPHYISFMNIHTDCFIAISDAVKNYWIKKGLDASKIIRIYNGVSVDSASDQEQGSSIKCVFAGSIRENKGQIQLINAIIRLPQQYKDRITVDFYGNGKETYVNKLKTLVEEQKAGNIISFKGYDNKVVEKLKGYHVGIMCSKAEGFGRTTAEYMMAGLCVIASDTGANPELIIDGECGLIYHYGDTDNLTRRIMYAIDHPDIRQKMALAAKKKAAENYTSIINAKRIHNLYEEITIPKTVCE